MSRIIANNIRHNDATSDNITLDGSGNVSVPNILGDVTIADASSYGQINLDGAASSNDYGRINFQENGTIQSYITSNVIADNYVVNGSRPLILTVNGAERLRVLSSGGLTFNGDTAAANALDEYEEGTYSVTAPTNFTFGSGSYTRLGRMYVWEFSLTNSSGSTQSLPNFISNAVPFATTRGWGMVAQSTTSSSLLPGTCFLSLRESSGRINFSSNVSVPNNQGISFYGVCQLV